MVLLEVFGSFELNASLAPQNSFIYVSLKTKMYQLWIFQSKPITVFAFFYTASKKHVKCLEKKTFAMFVIARL